jgi:hypothetical protein
MLRHYCLDSADSDATQEQEDILWQNLGAKFSAQVVLAE